MDHGIQRQQWGRDDGSQQDGSKNGGGQAAPTAVLLASPAVALVI